MKNKNKDLLYNKEKQYQEKEYYWETDRRDVYYSALVKDIIRDNRTGQVLKCIFFCVICVVLLYTCLFGTVIVYIIAKKEQVSATDIAALIAGLGSIISSILVLPKIIAKHLFPEDSEKGRFDFIKASQRFDQPKDSEYDFFDEYDDESFSEPCLVTNDDDKCEKKKAV